LENLFTQVLLFILVYLFRGRFKLFFLIINLVPLILYYFFELNPKILLNYYLLECIIYCLIHIICLKFIEAPINFIKTIFAIISLSLITISVYLIPKWNINENFMEKQSFWNYASILFSFYTISFITRTDKYYDLDSEHLKSSLIYKFLVLIFIAVLSSILSKYIKTELTYLIVLVLTKLVIDLKVFKDDYDKSIKKSLWNGWQRITTAWSQYVFARLMWLLKFPFSALSFCGFK